MESSGSLYGVSFSKNLRRGQHRILDRILAEPDRKTFNIQLPTGYGKTFTAAAAYSVLQHSGRVNRMLYIVPTTPQLGQFINDGKDDLKSAGIDGPVVIHDISFSPMRAIKDHRLNKCQIFTTTIQSLTSRNSTAWAAVVEMMAQGQWMIVVDEYHHYGIDACWGREISKLNFAFRLAMSATPYRKDDDSAFGKPDETVSYRDAVKENTVKPLNCHSYIYRVDVIEENGDVRSFTTHELCDEAGSSDPESIEKLLIQRKMRWSPKYVSPLVDRPIARMLRNRAATGLPLQVLVGAMCCSHAQLVCEQMRAMYPELRLDWVGTGPDGRSNTDNEKILRKFCPPRVDGERRACDIQLDLLVHVAMAGEGLDSIYVTEVVHLNPANINNTNNQENGRASRFLANLTGYISVDSSSPYAKFLGETVMDLMDDPFRTPEPNENPPKDRDPNDEWDLPDEPEIRIYDMECIQVDEGEVKRYLNALAATTQTKLSVQDFSKEEWQILHDEAIRGYRRMRREEAEAHNEKSLVMQWQEAVSSAVSVLSSRIVHLTSAEGRFEKSRLGDVKKRINSRKKMSLGEVQPDIPLLKKHWQWLRNLEIELKEKGIPSWLM